MSQPRDGFCEPQLLHLSFPVPLCRHGYHGRKLKSMVEDAMKLTAGYVAALQASAARRVGASVAADSVKLKITIYQ